MDYFVYDISESKYTRVNPSISIADKYNTISARHLGEWFVYISNISDTFFSQDPNGNILFSLSSSGFTNPPRSHTQRGGIVKPPPALAPTAPYMPPPMSRFGSFGSNSTPLDMGPGMPILPPTASARWSEAPLQQSQQPWFSQQQQQPQQQQQDPNKPQKPLEQLDYFWQRLQAGRFF